MVVKMKKALLLVLLFPLVLSALKVDLSVNKNTINLNEQLELILKISDDNRIKVQEPTPPSIPLFSFRNMTIIYEQIMSLLYAK